MGGGGGVKVSTKWRKYMKTCVNKNVLMFSYKKTTSKHVLVYFLQLVLTLIPPPPPHYIIMVKGLLGVAFGLAGSAYIDMHGHVCKLN